jgi:phosphatidate cytidylyltransferase
VSNLAARLLTAVVAIPILLGAIFWEKPLAVYAIVFIATALGLREWMNMTMQGAAVGERALGVIMGLIASLQIYFDPAGGLRLGLGLAFGTIAVFVYLLFVHGAIDTIAVRIGAILSGVLYVAVLLVFVALMKSRLANGGGWVLLTLTIVWLSDTGAYFAGRFLGPIFPAKLYESMSPKKTVVGACGGMAASVAATMLAKMFYLPGLSWIDCALVAVPANVLGQIGDLSESMLKRSVGVKDSGALLPGHGGMLDRIDALLFAAPYIFAYATFGYRGA